MMLDCFVSDATVTTVPIVIITPQHYAAWLINQSKAVQAWLTNTRYQAEPGNIQFIPDENNDISRVICCVAALDYFWGVGHLPFVLPERVYHFESTEIDQFDYALGWGLGAYQFTRYKSSIRKPARLYLTASIDHQVKKLLESIYLVRDWINTPADDLGPTQFAALTEKLANEYKATFTQLIGDELIQHHYSSIYTVGRGSDDPARLLDLKWGELHHPKVTLVGKGVCFDSGGLDIKSSPYMLLMKKDMAGGAHVLGLARMIMEEKLPIRLRVLIPVVENAISGNSYRPGDIIKSRNGLTIEIGNTDAEGRVILADALTEAVSEKPDLLIDITTLTGAARVALGTDLPAVFSNNEILVNEVIKHGEKTKDPMWQLPLYNPYREYLNSTIADINNNASESYGGAITAALFLKEFVPDTIPWLHFDMMAWNLRTRPGRPQGGEVMGLRALLSYLRKKYTIWQSL